MTVAHSNLALLVSPLDFIHLKIVSDRENTKKLSLNQRIQARKPFRLSSEAKTYVQINLNSVIFNFSQRFITDKEKEIRSKRLRFSTPPSNLEYCTFLAPFEIFHKRLKGEHVNERLGFFPSSVKAKLKDIALSGYRSYSRPNFLFSRNEIKTHNDLKKNAKIIILKPEKGKGVVIIDWNEYIKKMDDILQDTTKF